MNEIKSKKVNKYPLTMLDSGKLSTYSFIYQQVRKTTKRNMLTIKMARTF